MRKFSISLTSMYECHSNSFLHPPNRKKISLRAAFQHFPANLQIFSTFILDLKNKLMYFCGQISFWVVKRERKARKSDLLFFSRLLLFLFAHKKQIKSSPICLNWMSFLLLFLSFFMHFRNVKN